jgi:asparagine synthase (glutamine-hydrolysing)
MCGLAGAVHLDGAPVERETLRRMADSLRHRGPDSEGFLEDAAAAPAVGIAHRRLSIIDLSRVADQPIPNEDGSVQVALNGEIYNYRELREELEPRHRFRSQGDTEVIAHLYEERGEDAIARLDGMFVVVLWDAKRRRLLLARDPFGKKPLYYAQRGQRFYFASEIKALLAAGVPPELEADHLGEYLAFGYVPTPRTLFRGIRKLPPASLLSVDAGGVAEPRRYWSLRFPKADDVAPVREDEAAERVRELLGRAVRKRLIADVPLGVLLSGGVDSSIVSALVREQSSGTVRSFCVGFEGHSFYDERAHAARVARHLGTEHHASSVEPHAAELIETLLHHHDEPFGDSSALPTYLVAREARRHVTVVLNGDGGDETFAGYDRFWAALLADRIPAPLRRLMGAGAGVLPEGSHHYSPLRRLRRFLGKAARPEVERIFGWSTFFDLPAIEELQPADRYHPEQILSSFEDAFRASQGSTLLSRLLYLNTTTYLLDDLLPKMDRMSMAHGLEARSPLLDRPLIEYAATLPDACKRRGSKGKLILKRIGRELLPDGILDRPKHGFGVPLGDWFRGELRPMVQDLLLDAPRAGRHLRPEAIRALAESHLGGHSDRGHQLWTLLTLELWLRKHRL